MGPKGELRLSLGDGYQTFGLYVIVLTRACPLGTNMRLVWYHQRYRWCRDTDVTRLGSPRLYTLPRSSSLRVGHIRDNYPNPAQARLEIARKIQTF